MLATFRRNLNSWVARLFFLLLIATFVLWGVGDVIRNLGEDGSVATVAGRKIELPAVQEAYRQQMAQMARMFGGKFDPTPQMRQGIAAQALEQLITQTALNAAIADMGVGASDEAVRQAVYDIPTFRGPNGSFDRNQFNTVLRNNNLTEQRFLELVRNDLGQRQLLGAVRAGVVSPDTLTKQVYAFQQEKRVADAVELPFSAAAAPPEPTDAQLTRWYENHKDQYSTPEYRRIKAVVLSPETVSRDLPVSDDDLKAAYEARRAEFDQPEKRSIQVLLAPDEARAKELADKWAAGADWATMQKEAGASPVELEDATRTQIPATELADAAFAAAADSVAPPVHSALGWHVFKVTKITPAVQRSLDQVRDELRSRLVADKAADLIYDRAGKIDDLLSGGAALDELPGDLGLGAVTGTLDRQGMTTEGRPAPIPGSPALRNALIEQVFQMKKGDPARLTEVPQEGDGAQSYFAAVVEDITPPEAKPMAEVADSVRADWTRDAIRHEQETAAAAILGEVKAGKTLAEAALGLPVKRLPPVGRASGADGVPFQLVDPLFTLKVGEPTMVETPEGFTVAVLAEIDEPDASADPVGYGQARDALAKAIADDMQARLVVALRDRGQPRVNKAALDSLSQAPE